MRVLDALQTELRPYNPARLTARRSTSHEAFHQKFRAGLPRELGCWMRALKKSMRNCMSIEALIDRLPGFAKDAKPNLSSLAADEALRAQTKYGPKDGLLVAAAGHALAAE